MMKYEALSSLKIMMKIINLKLRIIKVSLVLKSREEDNQIKNDDAVYFISYKN